MEGTHSAIEKCTAEKGRYVAAADQDLRVLLKGGEVDVVEDAGCAVPTAQADNRSDGSRAQCRIKVSQPFSVTSGKESVALPSATSNFDLESSAAEQSCCVWNDVLREGRTCRRNERNGVAWLYAGRLCEPGEGAGLGEGHRTVLCAGKREGARWWISHAITLNSRIETLGAVAYWLAPDNMNLPEGLLRARVVHLLRGHPNVLIQFCYLGVQPTDIYLYAPNQELQILDIVKNCLHISLSACIAFF
jgi:hypothetical protein